jgi:hypothetical protein
VGLTGTEGLLPASWCPFCVVWDCARLPLAPHGERALSAVPCLAACRRNSGSLGSPRGHSPTSGSAQQQPASPPFSPTLAAAGAAPGAGPSPAATAAAGAAGGAALAGDDFLYDLYAVVCHKGSFQASIVLQPSSCSFGLHCGCCPASFAFRTLRVPANPSQGAAALPAHILPCSKCH